MPRLIAFASAGLCGCVSQTGGLLGLPGDNGNDNSGGLDGGSDGNSNDHDDNSNGNGSGGGDGALGNFPARYFPE